MLKVNTQKISIEEFAKKYGLMLRWVNSCLFELVYKRGRGFGRRIGVGDSNFTTINNCDYDLLFDMISSGDVVKEAAK